MLYRHKNGSFLTEATRNSHLAYGKACLNNRSCRRCISKYRSECGDETGQLVDFDDNLLEAELERSLELPVEYLVIKLSSSHKHAYRHI